MKKLAKIALIVAFSVTVLLAVILIGAYIFISNYDIKSQKPKIVEMASKALNRPVDFSDISLKVSLGDGVRLQLKDLTIAEDPRFGTLPFVRVDSIDAGVDLLGFLKFKTISIPNILIKKPTIRLVHDGEDSFNFSSIGAKPDTHDKPSASASPTALPALFIKSFKIENGSVSVSDISPGNPSDISLDQIEVDVKQLSLTKIFPASLKAALAGTEQNISITTNVKLDFSKSNLELSGLAAALDFNKLNWENLISSSLIPPVPLPQSIGGIINLTSDNIILSDKGISQGTFSLAWNNGALIFNHAAPGVNIQAEQIALNVQNYSLTEPKPFNMSLKAALFHTQQNVDLAGTFSLNLVSSALALDMLEFKTDLTQWDIRRLKDNIAALKDMPQPERLAGSIAATIKSLQADAHGLKSILADASLSNGSLLVKGLAPGSALDISTTNLAVKDFTLNQPFTVSLTTGLFSDVPNISFDGTVGLDDLKKTTELRNASATINFDRLPMNQLRTSGLIPAGINLPEKIKGIFLTTIQDLTLSPQGFTNLLLNAEWQNGVLAMPNAVPGVSIFAEQINIKASDVSLTRPFTIEGSLAYENIEKNIQFKSTVALDLPRQDIRLSDGTLQADLGLLALNKIKSSIATLKDVPMPEKLSGQFDTAFREILIDAKGLKNISADIRWNNGSLIFPNAAEGVNISASKINMDIINFSLSKPFTFTLDLAYLDSQPNIFLTGSTQLNPDTSSVRLENTKIRTDLSKISLEELQSSFIALKDAPLPEVLGGHFDLMISEALSDAQGLKTLKAKGVLKNGTFKTKEMPSPMRDLDFNFEITEKNLTIRDIKATIGEGFISARADVKDYAVSQSFDTSLTLDKIHLKDILDQRQAPVKVAGVLSGEMSLAGLAADLKTINGSGKIISEQTQLKDLNVLRIILDKLSFLPNVVQRLEAGLPEQYQAKLKQPDTDIRKAEFTLSIANGIVNIQPMAVEAEEFLFNGTAKSGLMDQSYLVNGIFKIPSLLAEVMTKEIPELQYILDAEKNISLPVNVRGQGETPPVFAVEEVVKDMTKNVLTNVAQKELLKFLGGSSETSSTDPNASQQPQPSSQVQQPSGQTAPQDSQQQPADPAGQLINDIFGSIFE